MCLRRWCFERHRTQFPSELQRIRDRMVMMTMIKMMTRMIITMTRTMSIIKMMMMMMMMRLHLGFLRIVEKMTIMTLVVMI